MEVNDVGDNYVVIVEKILYLMDEIQKYNRKRVGKKELKHQAKIDELVEKTEKSVRSIVKKRCDMDSIEEFLHFMYELRRLDVGDRFSEDLIKSHVYPKSSILYEIIMANSWNHMKGAMNSDFDDTNNKLAIFKWNKKDEKALSYINDVGSNEILPKSISSLASNETPYFKIVLTRGCFLITTLDNKKRIAAVKPEERVGENYVRPQYPFRLQLINRTGILELINRNSIENGQWILDPVKDKEGNLMKNERSDEGIFNIHLNYGEQKPRILYRQKGYKKYELITSMDDIDGYDNPEKCQWVIRIQRKIKN